MNKITTLAVLQVTETIAPKTTKKLEFNILVTDEGSQKYYLKSLLKELKKYPFLKQESCWSRTKTTSSASYLDVIVFGGNDKYDYTTTNVKNEIPMNFESFDLVEDFSEIIDRLKKYVAKNYPQKIKKEKKDVDIEITIEFVKAPKKKEEKYETYRIHDTFVKIGYRTYDIYVDTITGDEYIKLGNKKLFILEDRFGDKYLA